MRTSRRIQQIKDAVGDLSPWKVTFERGALQYPTKHTKDDKIIRTLGDAYVALGREPEYGYCNETIDAGFMNMNGIPTVMYGTFDMRYAHGDSDHCHLNTVYDVTKVYTQWAIANSQ